MALQTSLESVKNLQNEDTHKKFHAKGYAWKLAAALPELRQNQLQQAREHSISARRPDRTAAELHKYIRTASHIPEGFMRKQPEGDEAQIEALRELWQAGGLPELEAVVRLDPYLFGVFVKQAFLEECQHLPPQAMQNLASALAANPPQLNNAMAVLQGAPVLSAFLTAFAELSRHGREEHKMGADNIGRVLSMAMPNNHPENPMEGVNMGRGLTALLIQRFGANK